jgi:HlyD family secretion protein
MFKKIGLTLVVLAVVVALVFMVFKRSGRSDNTFTFVNVERGTIVDKALAIGQIEPDNEIAIKSKISGLVNKIYVEIGDSVRRDDPLIEIRPDPTPLEYAEAKRNVELAAVAHDHALVDYNRAKDLQEKGHTSEQEVEDAHEKLEETELRLKLSEEKLSLIESGKTKVADRAVESVVRSPINGTVLAREVNEGDPVVPLTTYQAGTELLTLASMERLIFKGTVDEIDVGKLREGMPVDIKVGALPEAVVKGTLYKISPKARKEDNTILFDVEIQLTEIPDDIGLRAGYSANAEIVINKKDSVLVLPERLVTFRSDSAFVEIADDLGEPKEVAIETGLSDGLKVEIVDGLEEGAEVIERPPKEIE